MSEYPTAVDSLTPKVDNQHPVVTASKGSIPEDAPIWMEGPPKPLVIIKAPLQPGVFMTDFHRRRAARGVDGAGE